MPEDQMIGRRLANFRIERLLGRGGMARVYYGMDLKLKRPVAIKIIHERYRQRPAEVKRFLKEAQLMAKWRHENIAQIYYCGDEDDLSYYVMEYIDGKDLASLLQWYAARHKLIPIQEVLRIGAAVAEALDYAHSQGVIHRDVKPANVLIAHTGRVVLTDFGLALDIRDGSMGEAFGTPHYISPEQALNSANAVPQSDLYSLGVILYEMLTGSVPFGDPSPTAAALQHIGQTPPSPRSLNPNLPAATEKVLLRALEKSPQKRYQCGAELIEALRKSLQASLPAPVKADLPPIPPGVPTIRQAVFPRGHGKTVPPPATKQETPLPHVEPKKRRGISAWLIVTSVLACLAAVIVLWANGIIDPERMPWLRISSYLPVAASPIPSLSPTATLPPTLSLTPSPVLPTANPASIVSPAETPTHASPTPTETPSPSATAQAAGGVEPTAVVIQPTATIRYPTGNLFTLFYNQNSLYLLNRSTATRSAAGFSFERLDEAGNIRETFPGWMWQRFYENLLPERCMILEVYDRFPYLNPPECARFLSKLNPEAESGLIFWTAQEGSREFRVLWRGEEVARCPTGEGICDFYTP